MNRDQHKICREEWFKDHKATFICPPGADRNITIINWAKPGTWIYGIRFMIHAQWLIAIGDCGEAVYQWSDIIDLKFLGGINFDYFHGKCRAADTGRKFRVWDEERAFKGVRDLLAELDAASPPDPHHEDYRRCLRVIMSCTPKDEFDDNLRLAHDDGLQIEDASHLSECGFIPAPMCVGHFVGLQMAIKQLTTAATPPTP